MIHFLFVSAKYKEQQELKSQRLHHKLMNFLQSFIVIIHHLCVRVWVGGRGIGRWHRKKIETISIVQSEQNKKIRLCEMRIHKKSHDNHYDTKEWKKNK